jgi:hypothetical protein
MEIYGISVVQNEQDVVRENLEWASRFFERIWVWDLGSSDDTWEILQELQSERVCVAQRPEVEFSRAVRPFFLNEVRSQIPDGAWLYRLDADEFLASDPKPILEQAEAEGAELVRAWHLNFYPVAAELGQLAELGEAEWLRIPLFERLRNYRVEWIEWRFLRLLPGVVWEASGGRSKKYRSDGQKPKLASHDAAVRHYRYRSPSQVARRFPIRRRMFESGYPGFWYEKTGDFASYEMPARKCRRWSDDAAPPPILLGDVLRCRAAKLKRKIEKARRSVGL